MLQVRLCFVYFIGSLAKSLGNAWWDGSNHWRSLIRPPFNLVPPDLLVQFKYALPLLGISICLLEVSYPVFIWLNRTRRIWLGCILVMHAAIGLMMGLYLFALVMIVMNLAAFGVPSMGRRARGDFSNYRAIKNYTKVTGLGPDVPRSSSLDTWGRIGARSAA